MSRNFSGFLIIAFVWLVVPFHVHADDVSSYHSETHLVYGTVDGQDLWVNAFMPASDKPVPAIVEIHGGWWFSLHASTQIEQVFGWQFFKRRNLAIFSVEYRLGKDGGFPENIRDCRNAIRFIRQNAKRFNIDPDRIAVTGGSAGGHLSL